MLAMDEICDNGILLEVLIIVSLYRIFFLMAEKVLHFLFKSML